MQGVEAQPSTFVNEAESDQAAALLARLRALPGVSSVNTKPVKPASKPNHFGVSFLVKPPGVTKGIAKRSACTAPDGARPTLVAAIEAAIVTTVDILNEHGLEVEVLPAAQPEGVLNAPTAEELQWLADWVDEQPEPEAITVEQADAALAIRRSSRAGSSQAGSSSALTCFTRLSEVQVQRAQLSTAKKRQQRAAAQVERLQATLPEEQPSKRARSEQEAGVADHPRVAHGGTNPPHWQYYGSYSRSKYQEEEVKEQERRRSGSRPRRILQPSALRLLTASTSWSTRQSCGTSTSPWIQWIRCPHLL